MSAPSPTARKLLQKLQPLLATPAQSSSTFSETQQTIASWMIFNRKKGEALAEGMEIAVKDAISMDDIAKNKSDRLLVLLKIVHRALVTNCPTLGESGVDVSIWEKSLPLRQTLIGKVVGFLLSELAGCLDEGSMHIPQVEEMMKVWEDQNVCDCIWEDLRQKWEDGLKKTGGETVAAAVDNASASKQAELTADTKKQSNDSDQDALMKDDVVKSVSVAFEKTDDETPREAAAAKSEQEEEVSSTDDRRSQFARRDSTMSTTSVASVGDIDFEGVEEAHVEPHKFLEAAKVIAQLQITRDIGGDTAMNLSSAFGHIPPEVEELCRTMNQQSEDEEGEQEERAEILSRLPDEFLDLDLKYAKQSLQTYKEAIRQQKRARLQCLHLLLQSRCSFGSLEAARILFGNGKSDHDAEETPNIDAILDKLKKRKEALSDALALEGLDVEEDAEEEKKLEKEEKDLVPFNWFADGDDEAKDSAGANVSGEEEPSAKKLKIT